MELARLNIDSEIINGIPDGEWMLIKAMVHLHYEMSMAILEASRKADGKAPMAWRFEDYQKSAAVTQLWSDRVFQNIGIRVICSPVE